MFRTFRLDVVRLGCILTLRRQRFDSLEANHKGTDGRLGGYIPVGEARTSEYGTRNETDKHDVHRLCLSRHTSIEMMNPKSRRKLFVKIDNHTI